MNPLANANPNAPFISVKDAAERLTCNRQTARRAAEEAGALIHLGRGVRVDWMKLIDHLRKKAGGEANGEA